MNEIKSPFRLFIIGAGGVAGYLLPALFNTMRDQISSVTIWDKDIVEERNLLRQMFLPRDVGFSKAKALMARFGPLLGKTPIKVIDEWFHAAHRFEFRDRPGKNDWIICIADNHTARRDALTMARQYECGCILGGNEYVSAQAFIWHPLIADIPPDKRYDLSSLEGSPFRCNTEEALTIHPQLAMANSVCATFILQLLYCWYNSEITDPNVLPFLPCEFNSNEYGNTRYTVSDCRRAGTES